MPKSNCTFRSQVFKYCVLKFAVKVRIYANLRPENLSFDPLVVACRVCWGQEI